MAGTGSPQGTRQLQTSLITVDLKGLGPNLTGPAPMHGLARAWAEALERAATRVSGIFISSIGGGRVLSRTYGYPGSEVDLARRGLRSAGDLDALKARLTLLLLIAGTPERSEQFTDLS